MKGKKILFITWDGPNVNYLENLFLPIFNGLQIQYGHQFYIIQFSWSDKKKIKKRSETISSAGIYFQHFTINPKYSVLELLRAKYWDSLSIKKFIKQEGIEIIIPRATTSLAIALSLVDNNFCKLLYDADGFSQDERVDFSGLSPLGRRYRFFRDIEFKGYHLSKSIICRSKSAESIICNRAGAKFDASKVFVVNNGTIHKIEPSNKPKNGSCHLVYSGSAGPQYMVEEMLNIFNLVKGEFENATLNILTYDVQIVKELIQNSFPQLNNNVEVRTVSPESVQYELRKADIGLSFRKRTFSMKGVAPIKVSEYLSAGLSILFSSGIGDLEELLNHQKFAYCLNFDRGIQKESLLNWVKDQVEKDFKPEVQRFALQNFSLENTVDIYHQAIQNTEFHG